MAGHNKVYGVCENKCFVEVSPKKQNYELIGDYVIVGEESETTISSFEYEIPYFPEYKTILCAERKMNDGIFELKISKFRDLNHDDLEYHIINPYDEERFSIRDSGDDNPELVIHNRSVNWMRVYDIYEVV